MDGNWTHLEWDTNFFGFGVGCLSASLDKDELSITLQTLRAKGYRLVYWRVPSGQVESVRVARALCGVLAAEQLTYEKALNPMAEAETPASEPILCGSYHGEVDGLMVSLAIQAGEHSRFRNDQVFPRELHEKLYATWIARSVAREIAWDVLVARSSEEILGMVTLGSDDEGRGSIGLVAVAETARGRGVGRRLVLSADSRFALENYAHSRVVTQRENVAACRLYEACGYHVVRSEHIFHFWLRR